MPLTYTSVYLYPESANKSREKTCYLLSRYSSIHVRSDNAGAKDKVHAVQTHRTQFFKIFHSPVFESKQVLSK